MSFNETDLGEGCTLFEVQANGIDDVVEILHNDDVPWFIKREVAKNTLKGKGRLFAYIETEANEIIDLLNKFASTDIDIIDELPKWKIKKLERKMRKLREELQNIMKGMKDYEQSNFDGSSN
jgi:nucleoside-triphosphatase THEP1